MIDERLLEISREHTAKVVADAIVDIYFTRMWRRGIEDG